MVQVLLPLPGWPQQSQCSVLDVCVALQYLCQVFQTLIFFISMPVSLRSLAVCLWQMVGANGL